VLTATGGHPCFVEKISARGIAYDRPTSTLRTYAYDKHFLNVWQANIKHDAIFNRRASFPQLAEACAAKRAVVKAEMSKHGINYEPVVKPGSSHQAGRAFDVATSVINAVQTTTGDEAGALIQTASPNSPACTLKWGGYIEPIPDRNHFSLR
jgi:hypothetical protein